MGDAVTPRLRLSSFGRHNYGSGDTITTHSRLTSAGDVVTPRLRPPSGANAVTAWEMVTACPRPPLGRRHSHGSGDGHGSFEANLGRDTQSRLALGNPGGGQTQSRLVSGHPRAGDVVMARMRLPLSGRHSLISGDAITARPRPPSSGRRSHASCEATLGPETQLRLARGHPRAGDAVTIAQRQPRAGDTVMTHPMTSRAMLLKVPNSADQADRSTNSILTL